LKALHKVADFYEIHLPEERDKWKVLANMIMKLWAA
jgi:hypothetical protein